MSRVVKSWRSLIGDDGKSMVAFAVVFLAIGSLPLFSGPGYEYALALGLILPASLCVVISHRVAGSSPDTAGARAFREGLRSTGRLLGVGVLASLLHGVRTGFCDVAGGLWLLVLGPGFGSLLGASTGVAIGLGARRLGYQGRLLVFAALAAPTLTVGVSLLRFYTSPMVFAFDPFIGFFSGSFYDTVIDPVDRLLTYRLGTAGLVLALAVVSQCFRRTPLVWRGALAALGTAAQLATVVQGTELGHFQTVASVQRSLGRHMLGQRCSVVFDRSIPDPRAKLLVQECEGAIAQAEQFFETSYDQHLVVYAFGSAAQKGWLMGASSTYIAKPWRDEVYIQDQPFPHRVLPHEVAHVVAGSFAQGPFRVAGPLGGWIPDPGRIEGFAVAAAPADDADFGVAEWSSALEQLGQLPSLDSLFRLTFLGHNSSKAYTVAGAFVRFLRREMGAEVLRDWYAGATLEQATEGTKLSDLSERFRAYLTGVAVSERTTELAKDRFRQPALFGRRCPHEVDALLEEGSLLLGSGRLSSARDVFQEVLRLDPYSFSAQVGLSRCVTAGAARVPAETEALRRMLEQTELSPAQQARLWERLGDRLLAQGHLGEADTAYEQALPLARDENRRRALQVKRYAAQHSEARAIVSLLVGDASLERDDLFSGAQLGRWSESQPEVGLADYLMAKNFFTRGLYAEAKEALQRASARELPLESVRLEAARLAVLIACTEGDPESLSRLLRAYAEIENVSAARRAGMARVAKRCGSHASPGLSLLPSGLPTRSEPGADPYDGGPARQRPD